MAAGKRTRTRRDSARATAGAVPLSAAGDAADDESPEDAQERKLSKIVEGFAGQSDMSVRIWRVVDRQPHYLEKFPLTPNLLDDVAQKWGGGVYRCRVINGKNQFPQGGSFTFTIEGESLSGARQTATKTTAGGMDDIARMGMLELFNSMQLNNRATLEFVKAQSAPKTDPLDTLMKLGTLATPLILKWWDTREKPLSRDELEALIKTGRRESAPARGFGDVVGQLKELDEMRELLGGGDGDGRGSVAMGMFEKLAPLVTRILDRIPTTQGAAAANGDRIADIPAPIADGSADRNDEHGVEQAMPGNAVAWVEQMRTFEPHIFNTAASGEDPREFAQSLRFWIPKPMQGQLREVLSQDDAAAQILQNFPRLGMYPQWIGDFIDELTVMFVGEDDDDPTDEMPD